MRVLVDSSTLIALARIGKLDVLKTVFENVYITTMIKKEILKEESPDAEAFKESIGQWGISGLSLNCISGRRRK